MDLRGNLEAVNSRQTQQCRLDEDVRGVRRSRRRGERRRKKKWKGKVCVLLQLAVAKEAVKTKAGRFTNGWEGIGVYVLSGQEKGNLTSSSLILVESVVRRATVVVVQP